MKRQQDSRSTYRLSLSSFLGWSRVGVELISGSPSELGVIDHLFLGILAGGVARGVLGGFHSSLLLQLVDVRTIEHGESGSNEEDRTKL